MEPSTDKQAEHAPGQSPSSSEMPNAVKMSGQSAQDTIPGITDDNVHGTVNSAGEGGSEEELGVEVEVEHAVKKKKKKSKSRSKSKRGLNAPTGFEEFHADAPMTPDEYAKDQELYASDLPFVNRILAAIQRFEHTRKMSPERRDIFYKYLAYGGVDVSPNMFQSKADLDPTGMDKDELAMAMSKIAIGSDKYDLNSPHALYTVDFLACAQAFLSRHAASLYGFETFDKVTLVTTTLERFMDYLLQHDVCPEYKSEVTETRNMCRRAAHELWACAEAYRWLPGDFNIACSTLFGGIYSENYDAASEWNNEPSEEATFIGMTPEQATQVIKFGVAGAATEVVYQKYLAIINSNGSQSFEVVSRRRETGFTITKIFQPTKDCIKLYKMQSSEFRPVGRIVAKTWTNPDAPPEDLTPEERKSRDTILSTNIRSIRPSSPPTKPTSKLIDLTKPDEYTFLIELPLISHLQVGMHLEATIHELNCGIWWFDDFRTVYPSFDTYLTNDLMLGWKEPRWLKGSVEYEREREREEEEEKARREEAGGDGGDADEEGERVRHGTEAAIAQERSEDQGTKAATNGEGDEHEL